MSLTSYATMHSKQQRVNLVLNWAVAMVDRTPFDRTFAFSLHEQLSEGRRLTDRQTRALDRIISRFHMERWADKVTARGEDPYENVEVDRPQMVDSD